MKTFAIIALFLISGCVSNLIPEDFSRKVVLNEEVQEEIHFGPMPEPRYVPVGKRNGAE